MRTLWLSLRPKPYASYTGQVMRPGCYRHDTNYTGSTRIAREAVATNFVGTNRTSRTRPTRDARERELAGWSEVSAPSARARGLNIWFCQVFMT